MTQAQTRSQEGKGHAAQLDGILNIDKPSGITSMDVVRRIKRASGQKRVGHGGTLDPIASGVVPVCVGRATRLMEYLISGTKEYLTEVELGVETDTYDALGSVVGRQDASSVSLSDLESALLEFKGTILQVPPMFSALKKDGKRLYDLARAGVEVEREPRKVEVYGLDLLDWSPPVATLHIRCGRGFYVRSLAHDIGRALGYGGHMKALVRQRTGPFRLADAVSIEEVEESANAGDWADLLNPPDIVLRHLRAAIVDSRVQEMIRQGRAIPPGLRIPASRPDEECRVYTVDGTFLATMSFDASQGRWQPRRVFTG